MFDDSTGVMAEERAEVFTAQEPDRRKHDTCRSKSELRTWLS